MDHHRKLAWAWEQIQTIDTEIEAFFRAGHLQSRVEIDRPMQQIRVIGELSEPIPQNWPLKVGDIVHNLRSALDHLVWAISSHDQNFASADESQKRRVQFPICINYGEYFGRKPKQGQRAKRCHFIEPLALAEIDALQPYLLGSNATSHILAILNELSNHDKHHTIIAAPMIATMPYVRIQGVGGPLTQLATSDWRGPVAIRSGASITTFHFHAPIASTPITVEPTVEGELALFIPRLNTEIPAIKSLKTTHDFIRDHVFTKLDHFV